MTTYEVANMLGTSLGSLQTILKGKGPEKWYSGDWLHAHCVYLCMNFWLKTKWPFGHTIPTYQISHCETPQYDITGKVI